MRYGISWAVLLYSLGCLAPACSSNSTTQVVGGSGTGGAGGAAGGSSTDLTCRNYCNAINANCVSANDVQYKSDLSCMSSCAAFAPGMLTDTATNTLGCRFAHALDAAESPDQNCSAAGPSGGGVCGTNCEAYCSLMFAICPSVYEDQATCFSACGKMVGVNETAYHFGASGDNLQCRIYHATFAAEGSAAIHCVHAAPVPADPCISPPDAG